MDSVQKSIDVQALYVENKEQLFETLYKEHRAPFVRWLAKRYTCSEHEAVEVFQESLIVLHYQLQTGKLTKLNSSLKTYLFAIGKNLMLKQLNRQQRIVLQNDGIPEIAVDQITRIEDLNEKQIMINEAFTKLGTTCQEVLKLFYYRNFSMDAIVDRLGFKSNEVARSKKYKCLKQLKQLLTTTMRVK